MQVSVVVQLNHIAGRLAGFRPRFVHEPDRSLDDMSELPRPLIRSLENGGGPLQVVTRKHVGWRQSLSPSG